MSYSIAYYIFEKFGCLLGSLWAVNSFIHMQIFISSLSSPLKKEILEGSPSQFIWDQFRHVPVLFAVAPATLAPWMFLPIKRQAFTIIFELTIGGILSHGSERSSITCFLRIKHYDLVLYWNMPSYVTIPTNSESEPPFDGPVRSFRLVEVVEGEAVPELRQLQDSSPCLALLSKL